MPIAPPYQDWRPARLLAVLGVVAAIVLVRAEASQAAYSISSSAVAAESTAEEREGQVLCRGGSNLGPCFFIAVTVLGGGRVESTADPAGTMVRCPPASGHGCTVPEWFIWALDVPDPYIEFIPVATTGQWSGWTGPYSPVCHTAKPGDPAVAGNRCRIYANNLDTQNYEHCITANFTGTGSVGECVEGTTPPVGDPVLVQKQGTGSGIVGSQDGGIHCGTTCSKVYPLSTEPVILNAQAAPGSVFAGWSGEGHSCTTSNACPVTVQGQTIRVVATFTATSPPPPPPPPPPPSVLNAVLLVKPAKTTRSRTARFAWGAKRNGVFTNPFTSQCKLNKQVWKACRPTKTYTNLKRGRTHTFRVRVRDNLNTKWDPTPAVWTWRIRR